MSETSVAATITTRRFASIAASAVAVASVCTTPAAADDPVVETDRACYLQDGATTVQVRGTGFTPGAPFDVLLDDQALAGGTAVVGDDGTMSGSFSPPALPADVVQRRFQLGLRTGQETAATQFTVTRLRASFWPTTGSAGTLRVRFSLFGFGLGGPVSAAYLHYVTPSGRLARTVPLGRPQGQCGAIPKTRRMRLFPFAATCPGTWRLQFDTRRRYTPGSPQRSFLYYTLSVQVRPDRATRATRPRCA